ncbi:MAG: hypothetical protein PVJ39_20055 [Gammaproteobacteria bacterium]
MNQMQHSIVLEPLAMEEIKAAVDHMIKIKQQSNKKRYQLSSDTSETNNTIIHTLIKASVENLQTESTDPVRIFETIYTIDKTTGDISHREECIQEWVPENDGSSMDVFY